MRTITPPGASCDDQSLLLKGRPSTCRTIDLTCDVACIIGGKEHKHRSLLYWHGRPFEGCLAPKGLDLLLRHRCGNQRCPHWTGRNAVHADTLLHGQLRRTLGETH